MNKINLLILVSFIWTATTTYAQVNHYDRPADAVFVNTYVKMDISEFMIYQNAVHRANFNYLNGMIEFVNRLLNNTALDEQLKTELLGFSNGMNAVMHGVVYDGKKLFSNVTELLKETNMDINKAIDDYNLRQKEREEGLRREKEQQLEKQKKQLRQFSSNNLEITSCNLNDIDVNNPHISIAPSCKGIKVKRVQITLAQTINDLEYHKYTEQVGWVSIDRNTYIVSYNTGQKFGMIKAIGIPIHPQKHYFDSRYEKINFRLIFPSLSKNTTSFNLVENDTSTWNFYGIILK